MAIQLGERDYPLCDFLSDLRDVRRLKNGRRYAFVLGSGASVPSGIPTGQGLVTNWVKELYLRVHPHVEPTCAADDDIKQWATAENLGIKEFTYEHRAEFYGRVYQRRFRNDQSIGQDYLRDVMRNKRPSYGYSVLAQLVAHTDHRLVITTNFDHLLEDALARYTSKEPLVCNHEGLAKFLQNDATGPVIAKIHGDIQFETYNAEEDLSKLKEQWDVPLRALLQDYIPVFIGYGGNDPGFMDFLHDLPPNTFRHHLIWTHRSGHHPQNSERVAKLVKKFRGRYVAIPGFDEFLLLLGDVFELKTLNAQMEAESALRIKEYRDGLDEAVKNLRKAKPMPGCGQFDAWVAVAVRRLLGDDVDRSWFDWYSDTQKESDPIKARQIYEKGLQNLPRSPELLSLYASYLAAHFGREGTDAEGRTPDQIARHAHESALRQFGSEHPSVLLVTYEFAAALERLGNYREAEPLFRRALEACERVLGPEHPDTLKTQHKLATLLQNNGELATAEPIYRRTLAVRERTLGPEHPDTLRTLNNLANLLADKGELETAEQLSRRVLAARERTLGPEHSHTMLSLNNLADLLRIKGDLAGAEPLSRQALELQERILGPEHPDTLASLETLASVLAAKDDWTEAQPLAERAVQGCLAKLGPEHPHTKASEKTLAKIREALANAGGK